MSRATGGRLAITGEIYGDVNPDFAIPGANVTVQSTDGSVQYLRLLESGDGEVGFTPADSTADASIGNKEADFRAPCVRPRGIARIYRSYIRIVASNQRGSRHW